MADDAVILVIVIVLVLFIIVSGILGFVGVLAMRRRRLKDHVWASVDLDTGETKWFLVKPDRTEKGTPLRTKWGTFYPESYGMPPRTYDGGWRRGGLKSLFRFVQGDPRPVRYTTKYVVTANPGKLEKVSVAAHQVVPSETLGVYLDQHDYAEAYSGQTRFILILILAAVGLLVLLVFGLYAR